MALNEFESGSAPLDRRGAGGESSEASEGADVSKHFSVCRWSQRAGETKMRGYDAWLFFFFMLSLLVIVLAALFLRHRKQVLMHEERLAALEKGAQIPLGPEPAPWSPRLYLLRGLIWSFSGVGLIIALAGISAATLRPVQGSAVWMAEESKQVSGQLGV